ncbi:hypothetical protein OTU49_001369, partial [Cherax quadricarinatus]
MEWANGDIRCNYGRPPLPITTNVQETVVDFHGYHPPARDYPPTTQLEYPPAGVSRAECTPKHCYGPPTTHHQYGITHPNYQTTKPVPQYPGERQDYPVPAHREYPPPSYPPDTCYQGPQPYPPDGQRGPCVAGSCSECPGGPACGYRGPPTTCYTSANECQPRADMGPPPDIHPPDVHAEARPPERRPTDVRPPPDVHRDVPAELRQECYDSRSLRSHHASHCDLREFQEWREIRGSRESVGTLPPELETHLKDCRCPCDHLGYGNYQ